MDNETLDETQRQRYYDVVESSVLVSSRQQFFVWTQSSFQALLPHEILVCGIEDGSRDGTGMHRFSASRYFRQEQFLAVSDPLIGLMPRLLAAGERHGAAVVMWPGEGVAEDDPEIGRLVTDNELKNLVALLVFGARGKVEAVYSFSRVSCPLDRRLHYLAELIAPHVHTTFLRVLANERQVNLATGQRAGRLITPRQEAILQLIKRGMTNAEIAEVLDCSPWTIKNHIQVILRKLDSHTRGHAIARAMSLGILRPD